MMNVFLAVQIHKSFMIRPSASSSESQQTYPSLAIVANAAKSSIHIAQVLLQRSPKHLPQIAFHIAQSNTVLMLIIWRHKRGIAPLSDIKTVASDVKSAFELLRAADTSSQTVGRVADKLMAFITAESLLSDIPAPPTLTTKRSRETDLLVEPYLGEAFDLPKPEYRPIVGSQRVSSYMVNVSRTSVDFSEAPSSFETSNFVPPTASTSWIYQDENRGDEHEDYMPMSGTSPILKDRFQTSTDHFVNNQSSIQAGHLDNLAKDERSKYDWDTFMRNVDEVLWSAGLDCLD
ncbi:hypothetical protein BDP27DRAFT_1014518 [Rhodocollybia butyracea]|uniref:Uncharacterized protein n=1 Tax=Rhodocollybia butyracea TaxID=206335 RepID=A0A9P5U651_9AGAR|nr:hypothetical protein BDP27DRAFT_1014518 [Rhodocollybia butyracea]